MNSPLPLYPKRLEDTASWSFMDPGDQYGRFFETMENARENSIFEALPGSPEAAANQTFEKRGRIMAQRLWLLGYLEAGTRHGARRIYIDDRKKFLGAVEQFQKEAGLKPDGWTGFQTWSALDALISFESDELREEWLFEPGRFPAVLRAVQCRLFTLGLAGLRPSVRFKSVRFSALKKFKLMMMALGTVQPGETQIKSFLESRSIDRDLLTLILDQDALINAAARAGSMDNKDAFAWKKTGKRPQAHEVRNFITRLVQVEFWLLGYEIDLLSPLRYPVIGVGGCRKNLISGKLADCLKDFARMCGLPGDTWSKGLTPSLFREFEKAPDHDDEEEILKEINSRLNTGDKIEAALEEGRGMHLRLWDGIKRIARWFGRLFTGAAKTIFNMGKAIARFFYQNVQKAFEIVQSCLETVSKNLETLVASSQTEKGVVLFSLPDGDIMLGLEKKLPYLPAMKLVTVSKLKAEIFCLAARVCGMILSSLINAAVVNWANLARILFAGMGELREIAFRIYRLERKIKLLS